MASLGPNELTHWPRRDVEVITKVMFSKIIIQNDNVKIIIQNSNMDICFEIPLVSVCSGFNNDVIFSARLQLYIPYFEITNWNNSLCKGLISFNSLWPSDTIWRLRSGSPLAQVMACCLTAPSHYLNQCLLIVSKIKLHSSDGKFTRDTSVINDWN